MSRYFSPVLVLAVVLILFSPFVAFAQVYSQQPSSSSPQQASAPPPQRPYYGYQQYDGGWYMEIKPGAFFPTGDLNNRGFDTGFAGEFTIGRYFTRNLTLDAEVGYLQTQASLNTPALSEKDDIWAVPVTVTFKGVLPLQYGMELSAGGGGGLYFTNIKADGTSAAGGFSSKGSRTAPGGHAVAGFNFNLSRNAFLGVEGKYIVTGSVKLLGTNLHLDGFILTGVLGYRF